MPVCVAVDRFTSVHVHQNCWLFTTAKTKGSSPLATDAQTQQGFIDERASIDPTVADSSRTPNEDEDEDERDDEMSEPTELTRAEKRKEIQTDETAKELRALLLETDSSLASSLRPSDETQEQPERSSKQARTAKKGDEALQDVSYVFQKEYREHQRNRFLLARMAEMRQSNKKEVMKKKDGERNLHFPSCTLSMCKLSSERRDAPNGTSA